jgi:hypothetical protein
LGLHGAARGLRAERFTRGALDPSLVCADSLYNPPGCYDEACHQASDAFSFRLIHYEILARVRAFLEDLDPKKIAFKIAKNKKMPQIPAFVLPAARALIPDCCETGPEDRPTSAAVIDRLVENSN